MISLALDTATRTGSVALASDNTLVGWLSGDPERTHGERLPGDLLACLVAHAVTLADVDLFAVCTGPGSFTGLRVGLATMQGLALAAGRPLVGIPTLEALAHAGLEQGTNEDPALVIPWMDAQRGETFGAAYHVENRVVSTEHQPAAAASVPRPLLKKSLALIRYRFRRCPRSHRRWRYWLTRERPLRTRPTQFDRSTCGVLTPNSHASDSVRRAKPTVDRHLNPPRSCDTYQGACSSSPPWFPTSHTTLIAGTSRTQEAE